MSNSLTTTKYIENKTPYIYKREKNKTILPEFINICKKSQKELTKWLPEMLINAGYTDVIKAKGYIYAKGTIPVLLTAHMDTVHKKSVKTYYERVENGKHILSSPQGIGGDDRCGIYMILQIIKEYKCSVLFCEDEEIGGIGSSEFCKTDLINELSELNYLIELDRMNADDAVFYDCDNPDFTNFIIENTGYNESWGSFSDISTLAPMSGVAAVNLSCGYYKAHTLYEEVVIEEMLNTINVVKLLLDKESEKFEYIECANYGYYGNYYGKYYGNYNNYYNNYDDEYTFLLVYLKDKDKNALSAEGITEDKAWKNLFMKYPDICFNDISYYKVI